MPAEHDHASPSSAAGGPAGPLTERFPALSHLDEQDDGQRIDTFQQVLDTLQREFDESRDVQ